MLRVFEELDNLIFLLLSLRESYTGQARIALSSKREAGGDYELMLLYLPLLLGPSFSGRND